VRGGEIHMLVATWKAGLGSLFKADPQKVANEIAQIGDAATPAQILDKARDGGTELHKCFEWDDTKAAEKWRIQQARQIVCSLVIKETDESDRRKPEIRVFHKTDYGSGYKPATFVFQNKDEYQKALARAFAELSAFERKYKAFTELDELIEVIEKLAG